MRYYETRTYEHQKDFDEKNRAQKIMRAYEAEDTYNFPKDGVAAAIRAMADSFVYDDNGMVWFSANDFYEIAKDLEAL